LRLTMVGQSTVIIELESGLVMITDPWFESFAFIRASLPALKPEDIPVVDLMLVSHKHIDHFDRAAIKLARARGAVIIGSRRAVESARRDRYDDCIEVKPGDEIEHEGIRIHATTAFHPFAKDAVGFIVEAEKTLYFCGDTRAERQLIEELKGFHLDVALVQIGCSTRLGKDDGMNLEEAARLVREIGPTIAIPIHYQVKGKVVDPEEFLKLVPPPLGLVLPMGEPIQL